MVRPKKNVYSTLTTVSSAGQLTFTNLRDADTPRAHGCSDEQIFTPVAINSSSAPAPGFSPPGWSPDWGEFGNGTVGATVSELNPYYSNVLGDFFEGLDFVNVVNNSSDTRLNIRKMSNAPSTVYTAGLRGPLIVSGWGYDICDRPVPTEDGDSHETDMQGDRTTWKSGPVNLQWDDQRKVWQGGAQIVCGIVDGGISAPSSPCTPTSFSVDVLRLQGTATWGDINTEDGEYIRVTNRDPSLEEVANEGMIFCVAVRINYEWIPIWVGCPDPLTTEERAAANFSCGS